MAGSAFTSKLLEDAVNEFAKLPGVGRKTAMRLVMHMLKLDVSDVNAFGNSIMKLRSEIRFCEQ